MQLLSRSEFNTQAATFSNITEWCLREKVDPLQKDIQWLEGMTLMEPSQEEPNPLVIKYCVVYNEMLRVPEMCFSLAGHPFSGKEVSDLFPSLNVAPTGECSLHRPLVSQQFHEEVNSFLWTVHSCDFEVILRYASRQGTNLIETFISGISFFIPLPGTLAH